MPGTVWEKKTKKNPVSPPQHVRQGRVADSSSEVEELDNYFAG